MGKPNTEKLEALGKLGDIRLRLGCDSRDCTKKDNKINSMTRDMIVKEYSCWVLGSDWFTMFQDMYDNL